MFKIDERLDISDSFNVYRRSEGPNLSKIVGVAWNFIEIG